MWVIMQRESAKKDVSKSTCQHGRHRRVQGRGRYTVVVWKWALYRPGLCYLPYSKEGCEDQRQQPKFCCVLLVACTLLGPMSPLVQPTPLSSLLLIPCAVFYLLCKLSNRSFFKCLFVAASVLSSSSICAALPLLTAGAAHCSE